MVSQKPIHGVHVWWPSNVAHRSRKTLLSGSCFPPSIADDGHFVCISEGDDAVHFFQSMCSYSLYPQRLHFRIIKLRSISCVQLSEAKNSREKQKPNEQSSLKFVTKDDQQALKHTLAANRQMGAHIRSTWGRESCPLQCSMS